MLIFILFLILYYLFLVILTTTLSKNAMSGKVLVRKVLGFKSVLVTPVTFLETNLLHLG
jgi:hypothetical protein